jgi:hypothetical protein
VFSVARDLWSLYLIDREYGSLGYDGYGDWPIVEGRYTLALLFEYAGTLGLFDLAYRDPEDARDDYRENWGSDCLPALSRYDGLLAVRMNALGAYVFGHASGYTPGDPGPAGLPEPGESAPLKVLATHDVVATGEISAAQALVLEAFACRTSERVWTVGLPSVLGAVAAGRHPDELHTFLREHSATEIPSTMLRIFEDAAARARALHHDGVVHLITCADPATAALIARDRTASRYCRLVGTHHLAVVAESEAKFRTAALALGYPLPPP